MKDRQFLVIKCPLCRKETSWHGNESRPFCSERCRLTDLGNWASGEYSIPAGPMPVEDEADNYN